MITLEAYRASIGKFSAKANHIQLQNAQSNSPLFDNRSGFSLSIDSGGIRFLKLFGLLCFIVVIDLNLNMSFLKISKLLLDGDIESNPGPGPTFDKVVTGSFHQGDMKFGQTAGIQCACNSLFAIAWSTVRKVTIWKGLDLDNVLNNGDQLFKSLNKQTILSADELPNKIDIHGQCLNVRKLCNQPGLLTTDITSTSLQECYNDCADTGNGAILSINGYTFSLIWSKLAFFLFDSHSRASNGSISPNGTSILLKFKSLKDVRNYIIQTYLTDQGLQSLQYELQFVKVEIEHTSLSVIHKSIRNETSREYHRKVYDTPRHNEIKKRKCERMSQLSQNVFGTPQHDERKKRQRESMSQLSQNVFGTPQHDERKKRQRESMSQLRQHVFGTPRHDEIKKRQREIRKSIDPVKTFKDQIKEGPFYICVVCNRSLYRRSVILFKENSYSIDIPNFFSKLKAMMGFAIYA